MNPRSLPLLLGVLGASLLPLLSTATASAQVPPPPPGYVAVPPPPSDGPRFRGGVDLHGGAYIFTATGGAIKIGAVGVSGQLGAQINNNWAVYGVPTLDIVFGSGSGGVAVGAGAMADYTFDSVPIGVAAGPEVGSLVAFGSGAAAAGVFYGARLRGAFYPVISKGDNGIRRKALAISLDLRMLLGTVGAESVSVGGFSASASDHAFLISPMVGIGYTAF